MNGHKKNRKTENVREDKGVVTFCEPVPNVGIHSVNVRLVHSHGLPSQTRGVVDWNVVKIRVVLPVLVQDQQELLSASQSKSWH